MHPQLSVLYFVSSRQMKLFLYKSTWSLGLLALSTQIPLWIRTFSTSCWEPTTANKDRFDVPLIQSPLWAIPAGLQLPWSGASLDLGFFPLRVESNGPCCVVPGIFIQGKSCVLCYQHQHLRPAFIHAFLLHRTSSNKLWKHKFLKLTDIKIH